jgi:hypothetical protein
VRNYHFFRGINLLINGAKPASLTLDHQTLDDHVTFPMSVSNLLYNLEHTSTLLVAVVKRRSDCRL